MRRRLAIIAIFVLAGALVNVAVAWGLARFATELHWVKAPQPGEIEAIWKRHAGEGWPAAPTTIFQRETPISLVRGGPQFLATFGVTRAVLQSSEATLSSQTTHTVEEAAAGWPVRSFRGGVSRTDSDGREVESHVRGGFLVTVGTIEPAPYLGRPAPVPDIRVVPYSPVWGGVTINTLFYAAALWLLVTGPLVSWRLIRQRRGQCSPVDTGTGDQGFEP